MLVGDAVQQRFAVVQSAANELMDRAWSGSGDLLFKFGTLSSKQKMNCPLRGPGH